jgi:hypothetical protein
MIKIKELYIRIQPSIQVKNYSTVDVRIRVNGVEKELNELIYNSDIESKLDILLKLLKTEVINNFKEYEEE